MSVAYPLPKGLPEESEPMAFDPSLLPERPDISHIEVDNDDPVESWYHEKVSRFLVSTIHASWRHLGPDRPFVCGSDVGIFYGLHTPPIVPDVLLSCDVQLAGDFSKKYNQSYFTWEFGKAPELVVEIISNRKGGEDDRKREIYAEVGVPWYAIHDPRRVLGKGPIWVLELRGKRYVKRRDWRIPRLGLGLTLWDGEFEGVQSEWLRFTDADGNLLATAEERLAQTREQAAEAEAQAAEAEAQAAEASGRLAEAQARAAALEARLRALGVDPSDLG